MQRLYRTGMTVSGRWSRKMTTNRAPASWHSFGGITAAPQFISGNSDAPRAACYFSSSSTVSSSSSSSAVTPTLSNSRPNLQKVLIANRGEIACRIIRTCRRLGIPTVAIYSSADGPTALHAQMANEAYRVGTGPTPAESYLLPNAILEIAATCRADAIHPGYGFLSERAAFCTAVQDAGIAFVGPPATAMQAMASKSEAKAMMEAAGVPTTPGYHDMTTDQAQPQDPALLLHHAHLIGFPVLIKAVMGGGGKGMRLVWQASDFLNALAACQRESQAAFGNAAVLLEKYLIRPRHVEVQIMADTHGNVVHLHQRDCSLQRRHQKIIEEAPASDLSLRMREHLGDMGKRAAQAVGYVNAGTVEFLLDSSTHQNNNNNNESLPSFYFCEMNTRLQVEHCVTEMITGLDMVEWQLRIAAGEPLPITQQELVPCVGHAFEARIYAENPARNFLPAVGTIWHHRPPVQATTNDTSGTTTGVRVDTGLQQGQAISVYYDPMISKLIVHDQDRPSALRKLVQALKDYQIAGVPTNIDLLVHCAQHPVFGQAGAVNTGFLEDYAEDVRLDETTTTMPSPPLAQRIGAYAVLLFLENRIMDGLTVAAKETTKETTRSIGPWSSRSGSWRMGGTRGRARQTLRLVQGGEIVCVSNRDGSFDIQVVPEIDIDNPAATTESEESFQHITGSLDTNGEMQVVVNGTLRIQLTTVLQVQHDTIHVRMWPRNVPNSNEPYSWELHVQHPLVAHPSNAVSGSGGAAAGGGSVQSPMPGTIRRILCEVGETVKVGQVVMVMEAMKMEHSIPARRDGMVTEIRCQVGQVVPDGAVLVVVKDKADDDAIVVAGK